MRLDLVRDSGAAMPAIDPEMDSLRIWHCSYRTLRPIGQLSKLRALVIATFPDESLDFLRALNELRYLRIVHLPKVHDLAPLRNLLHLEVLSLSTLPSWDASGKTTEVESLEPIADLPSLKHVELFGVVPKSKAVGSLKRCPKLISARFANYAVDEIERFYAATGISDSFAPEPGAG
jgi:hypothetical protein